MKRVGYLYERVCSIDNLVLADKRARRGKSGQKSVKLFDENKQDNLINLHHLLTNKEYSISEYRVFKLFDKKERVIYELPYKDRVVQWAIINVIGDILVKSFTVDTYSCIKHRGISLCSSRLVRALKDKVSTKYCLKLDIKKFYPSVNKEILKRLLRKKFKDNDLLELLANIIDSSDNGLPIGNLLSQYLGNFYLNYFLHYLKEDLKVKNLFVYCDDITILGSSKDYLRKLLSRIKVYLLDNLGLSLSNYQIFPVEARGIDFLGYVFYHDYKLLRKSIKLNFIRMVKYNDNIKSRAAYKGWLDHANCINLKNKYLNGK